MEKLQVDTVLYEWINPETDYHVQVNLLRPNIIETITSGDPAKDDIIRLFNFLDSVFEANYKANPSGKFFHILVIKNDKSFPIVNRIYAVNRCLKIIKQNWITQSYLASETTWAYLLGLVLNKAMGVNHVKFAASTTEALLDIERNSSKLKLVESADLDIEKFSREELIDEIKKLKLKIKDQTELLAARLSTLSWTKNQQELPHHEVSEEFLAAHKAANMLERDLEHFKEELAIYQLQQSEKDIAGPERFKKSEHNLRLLLDHSDEAIGVIGENQCFLDFNRHFAHTLSRISSIEVYRGMPLSEISDQDSVQSLWHSGAKQAFEGKENEQIVSITLAEQPEHFQLKFVPVKYLNKVESIIIFQRDITDSFLKEQHLKEKNEFIDNLINTVPGLIYVYNHALKKTVFQSRPAQILFTYSKSNRSNYTLSLEEIVHSSFTQYFGNRQDRWQYARENDVLEMEFLIDDGLGSSEWVITREKVFKRDHEGKVLETIGFANSNQSKKSTEEKLVTRLLTEKIITSASSKLIGLTLQNFASVFDELLNELKQHGLLNGGFSQLWGPNHNNYRSFICWSENYPAEERVKVHKGELFDLAWVKKMINESDFLLFSHKNEIPAEALFNENIAIDLGADKFLLLPITSRNGRNGVFVVFKSAKSADWHFEQIQLFILLSEMIWNALEKLRYEKEINTQNSKLSSILENTSDNAWSVNLNFSLLTFNSAFQSSFKNSYGHQLFVGACLEELVPEEDWIIWKSLYKRSFAGEKFNTEWVSENQIFELSFHPIVESGQVTGCTVVARNITYRSIFERKLLNSENMLTAIINNSDDMIWMVDRDLRLIKYNQKIECFISNFLETQLEPGMYIIFEKQPEAYKQYWLELYQRALQREKISEEWQVQDYIFEISINPIVEANTVKYLGVYMKNITERKQVENTILEQNEELSKVNKELDSFVYKASHDLRAPLVSMLGLINITRLEQDESKKLSYLEMQEKSIRKLDKYIKDIIDYSRNSRQGIIAESIDVDKMVDEIIEQNKFTSEAERLQVKKKIEVPSGFKTDPRRLEVVLNNLISNAIRYSDPSKSSIDISIELYPEKEGVKIIVNDNGIGIGKEHHSKVFDMFYRATTSRPGSGLGLYIVRESIHKLGGSVEIESKPGVGTRFILYIPNLSSKDKSA